MSCLTAEFLGRLLDAHTTGLEFYAAQWTGTPADVVQEAFVELIRQDALPERIVPWLYRVVRHRALNAARSEERRRKHETIAAGMSPWWFESRNGAAIDAEAAAAALRALPDDQREVIVMRVWADLSFEQISEVTSTSASTAHRKYQAGLAALRERMNVTCQVKDLKS